MCSHYIVLRWLIIIQKVPQIPYVKQERFKQGGTIFVRGGRPNEVRY